MAETSTILFNTLRRVLAPVARLMLSKGVTLPMAVELMKRIFVEVAEEDLASDGTAVTDSRISLLTGVHRKDIRRLRGLEELTTELPEKVSLGSQLIAQWTTQAEWLDAKGKPRALPRLASAGSELSFDGLVSSVSRDIRPRSVLDEWLRLGLVEVNEEDEVVLRSDAFIPAQGHEEKLAYYGLNLGDHSAAATDNLLEKGRPWFERSVHHDSLRAEDIEAIRTLSAESGMKLLREIHKAASALPGTTKKGRKTAAAGDSKRFTFGVYFYSADDTVAPPPDKK